MAPGHVTSGWEAIKSKARRLGFVDKILIRLESYTALVEQQPWLRTALKATGSLMVGAWVYLGESWLPLALLAFIGAFITLTYLPGAIRHSWAPEQQDDVVVEAKPKEIQPAPAALSEPLDQAAYNQIVGFCVDVLLPACDAQLKLQEVLIKDLSQSGYVAMYAQRGAKEHYRSFGFWQPYEALTKGLSTRTGAVPTFSDIIEHVGRLEKTYESFCAQSHLISNQGRADYRRNPKFSETWEDWRVKHNALVGEYEKIKRDSRFGTLFRPAYKSEWGGVIDPLA